MVGPSLDDDERASFLRRLRAGFALLVGLSMGLAAVRGDGSPFVVGVAVLGGTAVGAALAWWVFPDSIASGPSDR